MLALAPGGAGQAQTPVSGTTFTAEYGAYYLGLKLMRTEIEAHFGDGEYDVQTIYRTGGLVWWFKKDHIDSVARGASDGERLTPAYFEHRDILQHGRTVTMEFGPDDIHVTAEPAYTTFGEPPATPETRRGALDLISGVMQASMNIGDDPQAPCGADIPIFDGKQRYDLRLLHKGSAIADIEGYEGPVIECYVYYAPIAGFDPDDMPKPKVLNQPLTVWFTDSPDHDFHIPVRFSYPVGIGTLVIEARDLSVQTVTVR